MNAPNPHTVVRPMLRIPPPPCGEPARMLQAATAWRSALDRPAPPPRWMLPASIAAFVACAILFAAVAAQAVQ